MILQALVKHYEDLLATGDIPTPGWENGKISFALNLDAEGKVIDFIPMKIAKESKKKTVYVPRTMEVPQTVKRSADIKANFLCDNSTYVFGIDDKGKPDRTRLCFEAFRELHLQVLGDASSAPAMAVKRFVQEWKPENAGSADYIEQNRKELMAGANILFFYEGKPVTEDADVRSCWRKYFDGAGDAQDEICMVTGKRGRLATLHPSIKGVYGAQAMGTSLVSFNAPAFCSYGKEQGKNAPVSEYAANAYGAALNHLLNDREHVRTIGDTTVVCWADGGEPAYQEVSICALFGIQEEDSITEGELTAILKAAVSGKAVEWKGELLDRDRHFYVLGVAPNAARLSVRFFWQDSFGNMLRNIGEHYRRLEIIRPLKDPRENLSPWSLLQETVNQKSKDKTPSPQMAADTLKAILSGGRYPATLLNGVTLRIRADHNVTRGRAAIIKAYYLRNKNKQCSEEEGVLEVGLNEKSKNVPYNLGRLFAVLEHIQQEANPGINATIKDKYFNSAAATPAHIFPLLINLAQKHLKKLKDEGSKITFNRRTQEILEALGEEFPARLTLPEQGSFQLGYYHQTQKRYQKKEEK